MTNFYSRPCGRGDRMRELYARQKLISTHAPAGGATSPIHPATASTQQFLLTPLREGRRNRSVPGSTLILDFYSRPCGRGDQTGVLCNELLRVQFLLTPLREGRHGA